MTRWATRFRHAPAGLEISVFRTPGRARFRRSGRTQIATSTSTTRGIVRIGTVATGATGRTWPATDLQAADGYYRILGRIDDVINVAGHRLGTKEIESASLLVDE